MASWSMTEPAFSPRAPRPVRLLVFAATLRRDSLNGKLAALAARIAEINGATVDLVTMRELDTPSYDGDDERETGIPPGAAALKKRLDDSDAFVIASPEYNGSMPGVLKNTIDWTSRFRPQPFDTRHGLLLSASPSMTGGNRGLWALRVPLEHLGARIFPDMFSLSMAHKAFAEDRLADDPLQDRLDRTIAAFVSLVEASTHYHCLKRAWVEFLGEPPGMGDDRVDPIAGA
ncbi:MAG: NADPH:quinone oxidoreductase [Myxococcales bacterium]|nr:NADPH:quinone oxidoreductase [Myxococcales bacterium]